MIYVIRNNIGGKHDFQRSCNAGIWWIDNTQGFAINGLTTLFFIYVLCGFVSVKVNIYLLLQK